MKKNYTTQNIRHGDKPIPEMAMARESLKQIRALMVEFGLTPSSRSKITVAGNEDDEDDLLEKMLRSKEKEMGTL